jgi:hypothetical protein
MISVSEFSGLFSLFIYICTCLIKVAILSSLQSFGSIESSVQQSFGSIESSVHPLQVLPPDSSHSMVSISSEHEEKKTTTTTIKI